MPYLFRRGITASEKETLRYIRYSKPKDKVVSRKPVETTLSSVFLGEVHKMSSGNENVFFTNQFSDINYYPSWGGVKNQALPENQGPEGLLQPTHRVYSDDLIFNEIRGAVDDNGTPVPYLQATFIGVNLSYHGVRIKFAQNFTTDNVGYYRIYSGTDNTGDLRFEHKFTTETDINAGDLVDIWFPNPSETFAGNTFFIEFIYETALNEEDFQPIMVYPCIDFPDEVWVDLRYREFEDKLISYGANAHIRALSTSNQSISTAAGGNVVLFENLKESENISILNGEVTITENGIYSAYVQVNTDVITGNNATIEFWVESFDGNSWNPVPDTGKVIDYDKFSERTVNYNESFPVSGDSPVVLRLKVRSDSGDQRLLAESLSNGVSVPSAVLSITRTAEFNN